MILFNCHTLSFWLVFTGEKVFIISMSVFSALWFWSVFFGGFWSFFTKKNIFFGMSTNFFAPFRPKKIEIFGEGPLLPSSGA